MEPRAIGIVFVDGIQKIESLGKYILKSEIGKEAVWIQFDKIIEIRIFDLLKDIKKKIMNVEVPVFSFAGYFYKSIVRVHHVFITREENGRIVAKFFYAII